MTIHMEFYQLVMIVVAIIGGFFALVKIIGKSIDAKFVTIGDHLTKQDKELAELKTAFGELRVEIARDYVRRDDYIRDIGSLGSQFQALAINVERMFRDAQRDTLNMIKAELKR